MKAVFAFLVVLFGIAEIFTAVRLIQMKSTAFLGKALFPCMLFGFFLLACLLFGWIIPYYVLTFTLITVFVDTYMGYYLDFYHRSRIFDRFLHCFGSFSFALLFYYLFQNLLTFAGSKLFTATFVFTLGVTAGAVFEVFEFAVDSMAKSHNQRGLQDTDFDLLSNLIGSLVAFVLIYFIF